MPKYYVQEEIGTICITTEGEEVVGIKFVDKCKPNKSATPIIKEVQNQLKAYLAGEVKSISFPYKLIGTPFQVKVWEALMEIPYGETRTYKEIAEAIERGQEQWEWQTNAIRYCLPQSDRSKRKVNRIC